MADAKDDKDEAPKKKGGFMKIILLFVAMLAAAGGGAYGAFAMGLFGPAGEAAGPDLPKKVLKGETDPYAPPAEKDAPEEVPGDGGSEYRTSYYVFEDSFTSNLLQSPALIQVSLAASTHYDGRVIQWVEKHDLALRSRILVELANTPEEHVYTPEGREQLQERLTKAINAELTAKEGFGGIEEVYFREILVQ